MELKSLPIIDWELSTKLAGNKKELAEEILDFFIHGLPKDLAILNQFYREHRYQSLLSEAHKLHGALCYCGLPRLKSIVAQLENDLKNNIMVNLLSLLNQLNNEATLLLKHYSPNPRSGKDLKNG